MMIRKPHLLLAIALVAAVVSPAFGRTLLKVNGKDAMPTFMRSITADVTISGQVATSKIVMTFQNESTSETEADFIYTLPDGGVATYFAYWAGDEKVVARIVEKARAKRVYQAIKDMGQSHDPALVEMIGKNRFRTRVFPVFPGEDVKVELHIVEVLPSQGADAVFSLPIVDETQPDPMDSVDIKVRVAPDADITTVANNYGLSIEKDASGYHFVLSGIEYRPEKDVQIRIHRDKRPLQAALYSSAGANDGYFALALTPDHSITNPKVTITGSGGLRVSEITPSVLPNVKAGQVLTVFGRSTGQGTISVTLSGKSPVGDLQYTWKGRLAPSKVEGNPASKLWATHRMQELSRSSKNAHTVTKMSLRYGMPSKYTSWLAVPKAEMVNYKRNLYWQEREAILEPLSRIIIGHKVKGHTEKELWDKLSVLCSKIGDTPEEEIDPWLAGERGALAGRVARIVASGKVPSQQDQTLTQKFDRLCKYSGVNRDQALGNALPEALADELAETVAAGGRNTDRYRDMKAHLWTLAPESENEGEFDADTMESWAIQRKMSSLAGQLVKQQSKSQADERLIKSLRDQMDNIERVTTINAAEFIDRAKERLVDDQRYAAESQCRDAAWQLAGYARDGKLNTPKAQAATRKAQSMAMWDSYGKEILVNARDSICQEFAVAVSHGKGNSKDAAKLRRNIEDISTILGDDSEKAVKESAFQVMVNLARERIQLADPKTKARHTREINKSLGLLCKLSGSTVDAAVAKAQAQVDTWQREYEWGQLLQDYAKAVSKGNTAEASRLRDRSKLVKKSGDEADSDLRSVIFSELDNTIWAYIDELQRPTPDKRRLNNLNVRIKRLAAASDPTAAGLDSLIHNYIAVNKLQDTLGRIFTEVDRAEPNSARMQRLTSVLAGQLADLNTAAPKRIGDYNWGFQLVAEYGDTKAVLDAGSELAKITKDMRSADSDASKAALKAKLGSARKKLEDESYHFSARWGDPLISVDAPADAKQVIAIMPDGEIKVLSYNPDSKRWEGRFDIPMYAVEGTYRVTVVAVLADGTRKSISLDYGVDLTAPQGRAAASVTGTRQVRLEIEADQDTARVVAALPWGDRVELNRSSETGKFYAVVTVPESFDAANITAEFTLTDNAHNRTTITVDAAR